MSGGTHGLPHNMVITQESSTDKPTTTGKPEADVRDVEKDAGETTLQRQVSGPPYSIYSSRMKIWIISLVSISALISPFGATLFYPVLNVLSDVLHVTPAMTNVAITTYMVQLLTKNSGFPSIDNDRLRKP